MENPQQSPLLFNVVPEVLAEQQNKNKKKKKHANWKGRAYLFPDDMILYIENPKDPQEGCWV